MNIFTHIISFNTFRLLLTLSLLSGLTDVFGQVNNDYRSVAAGNWSTLATWQRHNGTTWVAATAAPTAATANVITISTGFSVTMDVNTSVDQLTVSATLTIPAGITLTTAAGTGTDMIIGATGTVANAGTITLTTNTTATNAGTINNSGLITINTHATVGTFTNTGTINNNAGTININVLGASHVNALIVNNPGLVVNNSGVISTTNYAIFNSGSKYQHNFPASSSATGTVPRAQWNANSTVEILAMGDGTVNPNATTFPTQNLGHFIWNYTTQPNDYNLNGTLSNVTGNFSLVSTNNKKLILKSTTGNSVNITGTATIPANCHLVLTNGAASFGTSTMAMTVGGIFSQTGGTVCLTESSGAGGNGNGTLTITGAFNLSGGTFILSAAAGVTTGGVGVLNTNGGLNVSGGTLNLTSSTGTSPGGTGTVNVKGAFLHTAPGAISETSVTTNGIINIIGTTAGQTIESPGITSANSTLFNISQTGAGTCILSATKAFVINAGTTFTVNPNLGVADFTVDGTLTANANTWLCSTGSVTNISATGKFINNSTGIIAANSDASTLRFTAGSTFVSNGNGGEVATALWNVASILQVNGITNATNLGNGGQSFGQIYWDCAGQTASTGFGDVGFGTQSTYTINSTGTGTLRFPDTDFAIGTASTASNLLILQNSSKLEVANGPNLYATGNRIITIWGHVSVSGTATLSVGSPNTGLGSYAVGSDQSKDFTFLMKQNFVLSSGTLVSFDHRSFAAFGDESYRLIFEFNGGGAQSITMPVVASNQVTVSGDGTPNAGTDDEFISNNIYKLIVSGSGTTFTQTAAIKAKAYQVDPGARMTASFALSQYALLTASGAVDNPSTVVNATSSVLFGTLDMGLLTLTDASGTGTFTLNSFAKLITKHAQGITTSGLTGSIRVTGLRTYNSNAYYHYNGTATQVTGNGLPVTLTNTLDIQITASATIQVTLSQATTISGTGVLNLNSGRLFTTATNLITIGPSATVTAAGGAATKFVHGPIKKIGNTAFIFPTGTVTAANALKWARIAISAPALATDEFTAEYLFTNPHVAVGSTYGAGITDISYKEYWRLTRVAGNSTPTVTLYWQDGSTGASGSGIFSLAAADLRVAEYYTAQWNDKGSASTTGTTATGTITSGIATTFTTGTVMSFTLAAPTTVNPLPIELVTFNGTLTSEGNKLNWITSSETNNDRFEIERSLNGEDFINIGSIDGQGNSSSTTEYNYLDTKPEPSTNYYRLKQVDFNGSYTYTNIIAIDNSASDNVFVIAYPNPTIENVVTLNVSDLIKDITVYNMLGEVVYYSDAVSGRKISVDVIAKGIYIVKAVTNSNTTITSRFTKN